MCGCDPFQKYMLQVLTIDAYYAGCNLCPGKGMVKHSPLSETPAVCVVRTFDPTSNNLITYFYRVRGCWTLMISLPRKSNPSGSWAPKSGDSDDSVNLRKKYSGTYVAILGKLKTHSRRHGSGRARIKRGL